MENVIKKALGYCSVPVFLFIIGINNVGAQVSVKVTNPIATSDFSVLVGNVLKWILSDPTGQEKPRILTGRGVYGLSRTSPDYVMAMQSLQQNT